MQVKRADGTDMDSGGAPPPIILTSDLRSLATLTYVDNSAERIFQILTTTTVTYISGKWDRL